LLTYGKKLPEASYSVVDHFFYGRVSGAQGPTGALHKMNLGLEKNRHTGENAKKKKQPYNREHKEKKQTYRPYSHTGYVIN
jgi:hypothetical protein